MKIDINNVLDPRSRLEIVNLILQNSKNSYKLKHFRRAMMRYLGIIVTDDEVKQAFDELIYELNKNNVSKDSVLCLYQGLDYLIDRPVPKELKLEFYKDALYYLKENENKAIELVLVKFLCSKFPCYNKVPSYIPIKYIFTEYTRYKPKNIGYLVSWHISYRAQLTYLTNIIKELDYDQER